MFDGKLAAEYTAFVGGADGSFDFSLDVGVVELVEDHSHAYP
jgi:hypothetical protein